LPDIARRSLMTGLSAAALAGIANHAHAATTDLAVSCDTTLAPALRALGAAYRARTNVRINVFATGPGLVLPQLQRQVQNDVVVTQDATLTQATQAGVIAQGAQAGPWRNRLVIAGLRRDLSLSADTPIAASDPSPAADLDGAAVLAAMGLRYSAMLGAIDCNGVAFLITSGAAQAGLLHMTDVRADDRLVVLREVPDTAHPPIAYRAAVTTLSWRPDPAALIAFLASPEGSAVLARNGLETLA
jgi:molybdate transport system substrate-binding protein